MNLDRNILLLFVQLLVITGLLILDWREQPHGSFRGVLFTVLITVTAILLLLRVQFLTNLRAMAAALKRAIAGNVNTRILANDDPLFAEVVFAINELIEQLAKLQIRTIHSEAARKSLLSNISHDIRTPLTSIIGYLDALKDDVAASKEEQREYLDILSRKANSLKQLTDEIFHLAKLDADEIPLKWEWLDLAEIAREAVIAFLPEMKRCQMELKARVPDKKCMILADRLSLLRILNNLIRNAVQYGKAGKVLGVELEEHAEEYRLVVWDQGPGMKEDELPNVFERMYSADRSRNSTNGGSGLGLAIAKALVEKHSGTIWAESKPGVRTAFGFALPKNPQELRNN